jgi:phosphohistidine phosphatase
MKTLLLLRHAKSSKDDPALADFDRPLNKRGKQDSKLIGDFIGKKSLRPDMVISSPAKRARQTTELMLKAAGLDVVPKFDERIYEASAHRLFQVVSEIEPQATTAVLVGHNPGFEDLVLLLTGEARDLPTASLICLQLPVNNWSSTQRGSGTVTWFITPKELQGD